MISQIVRLTEEMCAFISKIPQTYIRGGPESYL